MGRWFESSCGDNSLRKEEKFGCQGPCTESPWFHQREQAAWWGERYDKSLSGVSSPERVPVLQAHDGVPYLLHEKRHPSILNLNTRR